MTTLRIDFFEEYPTKKNLEKAKLIKFPSTIYIAANSLKQYRNLEQKLKDINPKVTAGYWPILKKSYWISPFSYTSELKALKKDLSTNKSQLKVMIDLELPTIRRHLFRKNFTSFFRNKRIIRSIFSNAKKYNVSILTSEYPVPGWLIQKKLELLGVSYPIKCYPHKKIIMYYSSMIKNKRLKSLMRRFISKRRRSIPSLQVGLGTIAIGVLGNEPIISPNSLERDLQFLNRNRIRTAVIFRLGGLNKEYIEIIKNYR